MKNVTPNRVLPHWAIEELGNIATENNLRFTAKPLDGLDQVEIGILVEAESLDSLGWTTFRVTMTSDWENLAYLEEGDIHSEIASRLEYYYA